MANLEQSLNEKLTYMYGVTKGCFLDVDPCLSLDSPFLDLSALEDLYQF